MGGDWKGKGKAKGKGKGVGKAKSQGNNDWLARLKSTGGEPEDDPLTDALKQAMDNFWSERSTTGSSEQPAVQAHGTDVQAQMEQMKQMMQMMQAMMGAAAGGDGGEPPSKKAKWEL